MTNSTEHLSRGKASRVVTFAVFTLAALCLPGAASAQWATSGTNISNTNMGNVGVGTATPVSKLHTAGTITAGPVDGDVYRMFGWTNGNLRWAITNTPSGVFSIAQRGDNWADEGTRLIIDRGGNVGVGTHVPVAKLHVAGDIKVDGNINAKYQDVAEWVPTTQKLQAGTVVVLDPERPNHVLASGSPYDTTVAGVISARPGLTLGDGGEGKALVATTGRVKVKVDATRGAIKVGDLLVTSGVPGVAMKSQPLDLGGVPLHRPGTLIGKALEPLAGGTGEILVLLSLQ